MPATTLADNVLQVLGVIVLIVGVFLVVDNLEPHKRKPEKAAARAVFGFALILLAGNLIQRGR